MDYNRAKRHYLIVRLPFTLLSSGNMSEIENGSKLPSTPALIALSSTLDCSIDWILKGESPSDNNADVTDSDEELLLLEEFPNLSEKDRSEIIEIIKIKLRKNFIFYQPY